MPRKTGGHLVEREFLTLPVWDRLDAQTAETVARAVERCLPKPWKFERLEQYKAGDQKRRIAIFSWEKREFTLIPGGEVTLGFNPKQPEPPTKLLKGWKSEAREWGGEDITWEKYLTDALSPLRKVQLAPFLLAVMPDIRSAEYKTGKAQRKAIAKDGFQMPTADQWEFARSGGSRAVWFWGNNPSKKMPARNAFGLSCSSSTYFLEAIDEPNHFRGGDGGVRQCGGCGQLESYVPFSTWFLAYGVDEKQEDWWQHTAYRRVWALPESMLG
jgi:hypothetical protein